MNPVAPQHQPPRPAARVARAAPLLLVLPLLALAGCAGDDTPVTSLEILFSGQADDAAYEVRSRLDERPTQEKYDRDGVPHPDAYTAHDQLEEWSRQTGKTYATTSFQDTGFGAGYFLTGLDGVNADGTSAYWSLSVNGEPSPQGMSQAVVAEGDTVTWTYTIVGAGPGGSGGSDILLEPVPPTEAEAATLQGTVAGTAALTVRARHGDAVHFQDTVEASGAWSLEVPLQVGRNAVEVFDADGGFANLTIVRLAPVTVEVLYTGAVPPRGASSDTVWLDLDAFASAAMYEGKPRPHPGFPNVHDAMVAWEASTGNVVDYSYSESFDFGVDRINGAGSTLESGEPPWWGYKVNGESAGFGITLMPLAPGDTVTWELGLGV